MAASVRALSRIGNTDGIHFSPHQPIASTLQAACHPSHPNLALKFHISSVAQCKTSSTLGSQGAHFPQLSSVTYCQIRHRLNIIRAGRNTKAVHRYSRTDLLRILRLTARQLTAWEKAGLLTLAETYSFFDLLQVKKVRDLCARRVRPAVIRESLQAMQKQVAGMENPLLEAGAYSTGARVVFRHEGKALEPIAGQFVMDFDPADKVVAANSKLRAIAVDEGVAELFARGIALEEEPSTQTEAIEVYQKVLELEPQHAAAHINVGTIFYNRQDFAQAEHHYRAAIEADPRYALAYFDLGNVLDETGRVPEAIRPTAPRSCWPPPTATPTTTWRWPMKRLSSRARRSNTGAPTCASTAPARGRCTPATRFAAS